MADDPEIVLPVESWTNGRVGVLFAAAYRDQVDLALPNGTIVEIEMGVFRHAVTRLLIAAYSTPPPSR